jgi:hypothetical protein
MGRDGVGAKSYDRKKACSSITHSILSRYKDTKGYVPFIQYGILRQLQMYTSMQMLSLLAHHTKHIKVGFPSTGWWSDR